MHSSLTSSKKESPITKHKSLLHSGFSSPASQWTYDITKSYDWNYEHGPTFTGEFPKRTIKPLKKFLTFKVNSLFGVPAGPLVNSQWIELYAKLGFDILTYKTVRTRSYPAFPMPHMLYVEPVSARNKDQQDYLGRPYIKKHEHLAMTNSFGVPSKDPDVWQEDVAKTLDLIGEGQLLIVSVMGTQTGAKNEDEFIDDYAKCAKLALEAGAKIIEINLSCPNLHGTGVICYDVALVEKICSQVKNAIGNIPLIAKIGYYSDSKLLNDFVKKNHTYLDGIAVINTIRGNVKDVQVKNSVMRQIDSSGICGKLIKPYGLAMVKQLNKMRTEKHLEFAIIGVGGVTSPEDYEEYIRLGANAVQSATGAMMDPYLAYKIYKKETEQKQDYPLIKTLGASNFQTMIGNSSLTDLKKLYLDMLYPQNTSRVKNTLQISPKPFSLKHGERGRVVSHVYLNHRESLLSDPIDRKLLAQLLDQLIKEKILAGKKSKYGVISIASSSSPELTALMLDLFPDTISRAVFLPDHVLNSERGTHTSLYGEIDDSIPWVLIDDVFTSGKTFKNSLENLKKILGNTYKKIQIYGATLVYRNTEDADLFLKNTKQPIHSLVSLNDILEYHWKHLSPSQKKIIRKERVELQ
ncbi:MAG: hypothetical protein HYW86_04820 [Candidatus Roizmanbacteria bacterium]|nr:MAG: hypothetical protein HYW86_04820 [Candidatus Roizmanbacteria bacterium]